MVGGSAGTIWRTLVWRPSWLEEGASLCLCSESALKPLQGCWACEDLLAWIVNGQQHVVSSEKVKRKRIPGEITYAGTSSLWSDLLLRVGPAVKSHEVALGLTQSGLWKPLGMWITALLGNLFQDTLGNLLFITTTCT